MSRGFKEIEHSADFGLSFKASSIDELFKIAAFGMTKKVLKKFNEKGEVQKKILIKGETIEELFVEWLNELIFYLYYKKMVLKKILNFKFFEKTLASEVIFSEAEKLDFEFEIKSATFHGLKIKKENNCYKASIIFDI